MKVKRVYLDVLIKLFYEENVNSKKKDELYFATYGIVESVVILLVIGYDVTLGFYDKNH